MSQERISSQIPDKTVSGGLYHGLQKELAQKTELLKQQQQQDEMHQKVSSSQPAKADHDATADKGSTFQDSVSLQSFHWKRNEKGDFTLETNASDTPASSVDLKRDGTSLLRHLGIKLNLSEKVPQLQQSYIQHFIQSKSQNFFLSKFAQFKSSAIAALLSTLGVPVEELKKLKQKALSTAVEENMSLMSENIYNQELTELVHGRSRKVRKTLTLYREMQTQLIKQMGRLGQEDHWSKIRIYEEKITQCQKIYDELAQEEAAITYQLTMARGDS